MHPARHDGKVTQRSGLNERGLGQATDGTGAAGSQREQTRVAKTANQHPIRGLLGVLHVIRPSVQQSMTSDRMAGLTSDVGRTKGCRDAIELHIGRQQGLDPSVQTPCGGVTRVGIDDKQLPHQVSCNMISKALDRSG